MRPLIKISLSNFGKNIEKSFSSFELKNTATTGSPKDFLTKIIRYKLDYSLPIYDYVNTHIFLLFIIGFSLLSQSCTYREVYNLRYTETITELDYFEFSPNVLLIDVQNKMYYHDTLSYTRNQLVDSILMGNNRLRIGRKLLSTHDFEKKEIAKELAALEYMYQNKSKTNEVRIPPSLSNFMKRNDSEVMAVCIVNGYVRSHENMQRFVEEAVLTNLISIPLAGTILIPNELTDPYRTYYRIVVFDSRCNCVRYYRNYPKLKHSILNDRKFRENINYMYRNMYLALETL